MFTSYDYTFTATIFILYNSLCKICPMLPYLTTTKLNLSRKLPPFY